MQINLGCGDLLVAKPQCDDCNVDSGHQKSHGCGMPQGVGTHAFGLDRWAFGRGFADAEADPPFDCVATQRPASAGREQRVQRLALAFCEPNTEHVDRGGQQWRVSLFSPLAQAADMGPGAEGHVMASQACLLYTSDAADD